MAVNTQSHDSVLLCPKTEPLTSFNFEAVPPHSRSGRFWETKISRLCWEPNKFSLSSHYTNWATSGYFHHVRSKQKLAIRWTKIFSSENKIGPDLILFLYVKQPLHASGHKGPIRAFTIWQKLDYRPLVAARTTHILRPHGRTPQLPVASIFHQQATTTTICNHQKNGNIWQNILWLFLI